MGGLIQPVDSGGASDPAVIVLAYDTWMTRFAADPDVIGHRVRVNGWPATVVGVTPPAFRGADGLVRPAGWVPASMARDLLNPAGPSILERRGAHAFAALARLQPGHSAAEVQSAFAATSASLARMYPARIVALPSRSYQNDAAARIPDCARSLVLRRWRQSRWRSCCCC